MQIAAVLAVVGHVRARLGGPHDGDARRRRRRHHLTVAVVCEIAAGAPQLGVGVQSGERLAANRTLEAHVGAVDHVVALLRVHDRVLVQVVPELLVARLLLLLLLLLLSVDVGRLRRERRIGDDCLGRRIAQVGHAGEHEERREDGAECSRQTTVATTNTAAHKTDEARHLHHSALKSIYVACKLCWLVG